MLRLRACAGVHRVQDLGLKDGDLRFWRVQGSGSRVFPVRSAAGREDRGHFLPLNLASDLKS